MAEAARACRHPRLHLFPAHPSQKVARAMAEQNSPRWVERIEVRRENGQGSLKFDGVEFPYAIVNLQINSTSIDAWPSVTLTIEANQLEVFNSLIAKPKSAAC